LRGLRESRACHFLFVGGFIMALGSNIIPYDVKSEEAGEGHYYARFTVGSTGAVPASFPNGTGWSRISQALIAVVRRSAGVYRYTFDGFFVPGFDATNQAGQMGSNTGKAPTIDAQCYVIGANGTPGTNATGHARLKADNTNNQDASGVSYIDFEFNVDATATDPASGDEVNAVFVLKTERP
jgi:hypothetical protein